MKKRNIKLTVEYDGCNFHGWQIQKLHSLDNIHSLAKCRLIQDENNNHEMRTVQSELKKSLEKICKEEIVIFGSGRTDSGVHALGQVAHFQTNTNKSCEILKRALNANLPDDVSIVKVEEVPLKFHAQFSVKSKTYRYLILNRDSRSPMENNRAFFFPHKINLKLMKEESKALIGRHDFKAFQSSDIHGDKDKSTVRTITKLNINKKGNIITIDISSNGFLYKMVRNIVGTLLSVSSGQMPKGSTKKILQSKDRTTAPGPAKAQGLYLLEVNYGKIPD